MMTPAEAVKNSSFDSSLFASEQELDKFASCCPEWTPDRVRAMALYCRFSEDAAERLSFFTETYLSGNEKLTGLLNAALITLFYSNVPYPDIAYDPEVPHASDYVRVLIMAAMAHVLPQLHRAWGNIPETVTHDTCQQASIYWRNAWNDLGIDTIYPGQIQWSKHYAKENECFIRLGRLEFQIEEFRGSFRVWQEKTSGTRSFFAGKNVPVDKHGFGVKDAEDPLFDHLTSYEETETSVTGHLVRPDGSAGSVITLQKKDCKCILQGGQPILSVHFPAGGGMTPDLIRESFDKAKKFFAGKLPPIFVTHSWVCNPNLNEVLPADSNLLKFQKMVQLMPTASGPEDGLWFIFRNKASLPPDQRPRDTSLQRAVLDYIQSGHRWRCGAMVHIL